VDFNGVTTLGDVLAAHAPVGAGIIGIPNGAHTRVVEAHLQTLPLALGHHGLGGEQVPEQLIGDAWLHRPCSAHANGAPRGARARHPLRIGMAGQHQDRQIWLGDFRADPVFAFTGFIRQRRQLRAFQQRRFDALEQVHESCLGRGG